MRISKSCAACLYDKQAKITDNQEYLSEIRELLDNRSEDDTAPFMVYQFNRLHEMYFGASPSFTEIKRKYNDLVLSMEDSVRRKIESSQNPLLASLLYARVGNYIDFGAMNHVDESTFLSLFDDIKASDSDLLTYMSFVSQCGEARKFLLIADNCGEIVLDKLFLEQLQRRFPNLEISALVRGAEVLNDATMEDAVYIGLDQVAGLYDNGMPVAGTIPVLMPEEAVRVMKNADVILAKGQGNYESLNHQGLHIFYSFLCKCELFTGRFQVPMLTGMLIEENLDRQEKTP